MRLQKKAVLWYNKGLSMHPEQFHHHAKYDANGNIILWDDAPVFDGDPVPVRNTVSTPPSAVRQSRQEWNMTAEEKAPAVKAIMPATKVKQEEITTVTSLKKVEDRTAAIINSSIAESRKQIVATGTELKTELTAAHTSIKDLPSRIRGGLRSFWKKANSPVVLPLHLQGANKKPPSKLKLFAVDTVRFGGTFAGIFVVLFVGINYQSFWSIASAELAIGNDLKTSQGLEQLTRPSALSDTTPGALNGTIVSAKTAQNLLSYLPPVGPNQNRLVIPKIGKNVPIVAPSMDALMKENWKQFEADVQEALHDGVVDYPGSAKPGQAGNVFITGHSSYYPWDKGNYKDVFARLNELTEGDTYSIYYGGDLHTYRVTGKKEVQPSNVSVLDQPTNKRIATLMTCTPVGTTLRRLIVMAEEIDPVTGKTLSVGDHGTTKPKADVARLEALPI
jgi:LPXTG-site transpeptidase (sortase) family protein